MAIGDAMKHNQCLLELNLSDNRIPDEGAERVAQGLSANDVLETLRVRVPYNLIIIYNNNTYITKVC